MNSCNNEEEHDDLMDYNHLLKLYSKPPMSQLIPSNVVMESRPILQSSKSENSVEKDNLLGLHDGLIQYDSEMT